MHKNQVIKQMNYMDQIKININADINKNINNIK